MKSLRDEFEKVFESILAVAVEPHRQQEMRSLLEKAFREEYERGQFDERDCAITGQWLNRNHNENINL
jgi:hypothetical protein